MLSPFRKWLFQLFWALIASSQLHVRMHDSFPRMQCCHIAACGINLDITGWGHVTLKALFFLLSLHYPQLSNGIHLQPQNQTQSKVTRISPFWQRYCSLWFGLPCRSWLTEISKKKLGCGIDMKQDDGFILQMWNRLGGGGAPKEA